MDTSEGWTSGRKEITKKEDLVMISLTSQRELVNVGKWGKKLYKNNYSI